MFSGTVAAISSTFCGLTATVELVGSAEVAVPESLFFAQPDRVKAPARVTTAAVRHQRCPLSCPVNTFGPLVARPARVFCARRMEANYTRTAAAIAAMSSGRTRQQPPMIRAPAAIQSVARLVLSPAVPIHTRFSPSHTSPLLG